MGQMILRSVVLLLVAAAHSAAAGDDIPCNPTPENPCGAATAPPASLTRLDPAQRLAIFGPETAAGYVVTGRVDRVAWDHTRDASEFAHEIAAKRVPVILTGSPPVTGWKAFQKWQSDEYLTAAVPTLTKIYRHKQRTFVYENENRKGGAAGSAMAELTFLPFVVGPTNFEPVTMPLKQFLAETAKPQPGMV